jgi:signal transduction histidine kinase
MFPDGFLVCHYGLRECIFEVEAQQSVRRVGFAAPWALTNRIPVVVLAVVSLGLPALLALHAVYANRELGEMRAQFLRDRAANIAASLEEMPPERLRRNELGDAVESDPALAGIRVFPPGEASDKIAAVEDIRAGRQLYHTEETGSSEDRLFRAYVPFHVQGEVYVARIDLLPTASDFFLAHARRNIQIALLTGAGLLVISWIAVWSLRRAARLERRQLDTERLTELGRMTAILAHEIRNPLGAIKGFAQLVRESAGTAHAKPLDAIVRESRRLESLVESLLLYGRPAEPVIARAGWSALAGDLEAAARMMIGARDIRFVNESAITSLSTDANMLKQALLNLIRNSIEAIPAGRSGEVSLRAEKGSGGALSIRVEDNGPGLPAEVRARLFSAFVSAKASGTGLGLSISKKLVESLGGQLRISDLTPHGTLAEVELYGTNPGN